MSRRLFTLFIAVAMVFSLLPMAALAETGNSAAATASVSTLEELQAAIDGSGGAITITVAAPITVTKCIEVYGNTKDVTLTGEALIAAEGLNDDIIDIPSTQNYGTSSSAKLHLREITLDGNKAATNGISAADGATVDLQTGAIIENCVYSGVVSNGWSAYTLTADGAIIRNNGGSGINKDITVSLGNNMTIKNSEISGNGRDGVRINGGGSIENTVIKDNDGVGLRIRYAGEVSFNGGEISGNGIQGVEVGPNSNFVFSSGTISGNKQGGIYAFDTKSSSGTVSHAVVTLAGGSIAGNTDYGIKTDDEIRLSGGGRVAADNKVRLEAWRDGTSHGTVRVNAPLSYSDTAMIIETDNDDAKQGEKWIYLAPASNAKISQFKYIDSSYSFVLGSDNWATLANKPVEPESWEKIDGKWHYKFMGEYCTGLWSIDNTYKRGGKTGQNLFYFNEKGEMQTGFFKASDIGLSSIDGWVYFYEKGSNPQSSLNGQMIKDYYVDAPPSGYRTAAEIAKNKTFRYYFDSTGALVTGWHKDEFTYDQSGKWRYFYEAGSNPASSRHGRMAKYGLLSLPGNGGETHKYFFSNTGGMFRGKNSLGEFKKLAGDPSPAETLNGALTEK